MRNLTRLSEPEIFDRCQVSLDNAESHAEISEALKKFGYNTEKLEEGRLQLSSTRQVYARCGDIRNILSSATTEFNSKWTAVKDVYKYHRKISKAAFRKDPATVGVLFIAGTPPKKFALWFEMVKKFYGKISEIPEIREKLASMNISDENLAEVNTMLGELETSRSDLRFPLLYFIFDPNSTFQPWSWLNQKSVPIS